MAIHIEWRDDIFCASRSSIGLAIIPWHEAMIKMERLWPVAKCIGAKATRPTSIRSISLFPQLLATTANSTDVSLLCTLYLWLFLNLILIVLIVFPQGTHRYLLAWCIRLNFEAISCTQALFLG
ncbi:hypothetical protein BDV34DRAFT_181450 [Aspergillus parasiticus]|uniref:Uncharacterized protein n=1 Tax=Aspergillus parasiticus TaxID=5067 RepID=A0A5N6D7D6_ASPPA|nr:hypothetical protein BDV34DRAFT_181450 [Aspergillus parasiticus]